MLLQVVDGFLDELEIFHADSQPVLTYPDPGELRITEPGPQPP